MDIAERFREIRRIVGCSQQAFADMLSMPRSTIANYEIGRTVPAASTIELICREFGVSKLWLETGEGDMFEPKDRTEAVQKLADEIVTERSKELSQFLHAAANLKQSDLVKLERIARLLTEDIVDVDSEIDNPSAETARTLQEAIFGTADIKDSNIG